MFKTADWIMLIVLGVGLIFAISGIVYSIIGLIKSIKSIKKFKNKSIKIKEV